jgi:hypothetical protein
MTLIIMQMMNLPSSKMIFGEEQDHEFELKDGGLVFF